MHFRQICAKKLTEQLIPELESEWQAMYHNAAIHGSWPDIDGDSDKEWEWFWECLGDHASMCIDDMQEWIKEHWDREIEIHHIGRGGATIYPNIGSSWSRGFPSFDIYDVIEDEDDYWDGDEDDPDYDYWTESLRTIKEYLEIFKFINKTVKAEVKYIPEWWKGMKEGNGWFEYEKEAA